MLKTNDLLDFNEASKWATEYLGKTVTPSNISYLVSYGRISKIGENGTVQVAKEELVKYYAGYKKSREYTWKKQLGEDLNWALSFDQYSEAETTKHVHRLHPYKGKFIPQLVEYFLDEHTDAFKKDTFFKPGDIVLDPFCGSGTTLVQASELGINAVGVDVSAFNSLISNVKVQLVDLVALQGHINEISIGLRKLVEGSHHIEFEERLLELLYAYNSKHFPSPEYRRKVNQREIDEKEYGREHESSFLRQFNALVKEFGLQVEQKTRGRFLDKWYLNPVREEIDFVFGLIKKVKNPETKKILTIILSRTIRSCRATTHADLATLIDPVVATYYCSKHGKICKPLFSIVSWWERYCVDTFKRFQQFSKLRTDTLQVCLNGDSRNLDISGALKLRSPGLSKLFQKQKIKGMFSSPPYVGLIDYHEQHAYAYDLFGFERKDDLEIGSMKRKQSRVAQQEYADGIAAVLRNSRKFLTKDFDVFLVANDKYNLYPQIAEESGMQIVNQYKRPVLNRTERDKAAYSEIIFHLRSK
ncbi:MAG TPA: DNA methyltransferase [Pyrinomonadaceae bacterium]|nr:DNA methyltransferase [Pyrinomonadaceae bacterium]